VIPGKGLTSICTDALLLGSLIEVAVMLARNALVTELGAT
jgi:hypothetical protein